MKSIGVSLLLLVAAFVTYAAVNCIGMRSEANSKVFAQQRMVDAISSLGRMDESWVTGPFRREDLDTRGFRVYEYRTIEVEGYPQGTMQVHVSKYCCLREVPIDSERWQPPSESVSLEGEV